MHIRRRPAVVSSLAIAHVAQMVEAGEVVGMVWVEVRMCACVCVCEHRRV